MKTPDRRRIRLLALGLVVATCTASVGVVPASAADPSPVAPLPSFALPPDSELAADRSLQLTDQPPALTETDLGVVESSGLAAANALTADQWSLPDLEWSLHGDPYAAFAFVRDHIAYQPYAGVLRGPDGTLAARAGNAFDRALLLKTLLDSMLVPSRFAFAQLDDATAAAVLARTFQAPSAALQDPGAASVAPLNATTLVARARRDYARIRAALGDRVNSLRSSVSDLALLEAEQHVWVQMGAGPEWVDLDTTMPDAKPGEQLAAPTTTADAIPAQDFQTVQLQLIAQADADGQLTESTVLDHQFTASDAASSEVFLYFQPDISGLGGTILSTLTGIQNFQPELMVDGIVLPGTPFVVASSGTDVLGNATGIPTQLSELRLVITSRAPGEPPTTAVKQLLDRVPASLADSTTVPLEKLLPLAGDSDGAYALQPLQHILISTGGADPRDHAIQQAAVADFGAELIDPEVASEYALKDILWPLAVADKLLALASERAIVNGLSDRPDVRAVIAQPRVYVTSIGPDTTTPTGFTFSTDLALDGVRIVSAGIADPVTLATYQIWYGALQTAMESEFALDAAGAFSPNGRQIFGASFATSQVQALTVLDAHSVPSSVPAALAAAASGGAIILVPGDPATTQVWWTVAPDGTTRSILDPALGGNRSGGQYNGLGQRPPPPRGGSGGYGGPKYSYKREAEPPSRCKPNQEYTLLLGCVSIPAAWAYRVTVGIVVAVITELAWKALLARLTG